MYLMTTEKFQNYLVSKATNYLSEKLHVPVEVKHVKFSLFNEFNIEGVLLPDQHQDTIAYVGVIHVRSTDLLSNYWNDKPPVIEHVKLEDVYVHLDRKSDTTRWNYDFIAEAFSSAEKDTLKKEEPKDAKKESSSSPDIALKKLEISNIRFYMDDAWRGEDMRFAIENLDLHVNEFSLPHKKIDIDQLSINAAKISVREYDGGKPEDLTPDDTTTWGTPFNPDLFNLVLNKLQLSFLNQNHSKSYIDETL